MVNMIQVTISSLQFRAMYSRKIAFANVLDSDGNILYKDSLSNCLTYCAKQNYYIDNSYEILCTLVLQNGFAA